MYMRFHSSTAQSLMLLERMLLLLKQLRMMGNWVGPWTPMLAEKSLGANVDVNIESKNATLTVQHSLPRNTQENTKTDSIEGGFLSLQEAVWFTMILIGQIEVLA